jgi:type I restriction enzyme S subunit
LVKFKASPFPLAPKAEQKRIALAVDELLSIAISLEAQLVNEARRIPRLRQSILKWAFKGTLVDQDPTDEPALVLLERIRAEREAAAARKPKRKAQRKKGATK